MNFVSPQKFNAAQHPQNIIWRLNNRQLLFGNKLLRTVIGFKQPYGKILRIAR